MSRVPAEEVLALIPARGGSKSIPRKNLQLLSGKPLIAHSIEQALQAGRISRVIVSTDDEEIAQTARRYGAEVPFLRPAELAQDHVQDLPVFQHALSWLQERESYRPAAVVQLRPTHPIRRPATIDAAIEVFLRRPDADSLRSVSVATQSPYKMWWIAKDGCLAPVLRLNDGREAYNLPRQSLPHVYWQNGYIDITRPRLILEGGTMSGRRILPFVIEEPGIDIDYAEHLDQAERLLAGEAAAATPLTSGRFPS
jgi:N-acylneuraminate cytidylyltransferase